MNIYTIYKATNIKNGKCYIGFDSNWPKRKNDHIREANRNKSNFIIHKALRKYGIDCFSWDIIYQSLDRNHCLNVMENYFIQIYDSYNNGYNMTLGGDGTLGIKVSQKTRNKLRKANTGRIVTEQTKQKISNTIKNHIVTEQTRQKIAEGHAKEFIITEPTGKIIKVKNLNKYCRENNLNLGNLHGVALGKRNHHKGYKCRYP